MSNRKCSYAVPSGDTNQSPLDLSSSHSSRLHQPDKSNNDIFLRRDHDFEVQSLSGEPSGTKSNYTLAQQQPIPTHYPENKVDPAQESSTDVNIDHMELLIHLTLDNNVICLSLGDDAFTNPVSLSLALKAGLKSSYLLYELLAISALHLASLNPTRSDLHWHQAITLQSRALAMFNSEYKAINETNCVDILLFSSILGHHLLADTLAKRDPGGLEAFMRNYIHCIEIHRGIHTIAMTAWPQLVKSELEPILSASSRFTSRSPRGCECQRIFELVDTCEGLDHDGKEACQLMIRHLQVGLDAAATEQQQGYRHYMIYTWLMLAPPKFIDLLYERRPEALILLAYYAILLHYGRNMWQVRDAGVYLFKMIRDYLHPQWNAWLQYPQELILSG
ncbi:uncharacterized protein N7503_000328 [Penicillium pulvis]|uniref:uncharacterized protein n=1 Tax=Penicillium pulvis TaxID=1562058 RepID=UPI002547EA89|nr:uncharacterized protein N7503_000328 [Penicillium pulvis]KAJ5813578.1 hypothetical protein N7503_000328 [Penicillium pulvis]